MPNATTLYRVLRPFLLLFIFIVAMLSLFRAGILVWQHERIDHLSTFILVLLNGLRIDISTLSYLLFIPALFHSLMLYSEFAKIWLSLLRLWFFRLCRFSIVF